MKRSFLMRTCTDVVKKETDEQADTDHLSPV
jgi:hypothetical protein